VITLGVSNIVGYHIFSRRVILKGKLTLLSGLHVGAGRAVGPTASDLPVLKDINGSPFIPGSSLKGVLRSNVEAFLRSFQKGTTEYLACCQVGGDSNSKDPSLRPCITKDEKEDIVRKPQGNILIWEKSCWVCKLFGSPWLASKVQFVDLHVASEWTPELLAVRDGVAIDRESETAAARKKFDFEVVPPGTQFQLEIVVENPEDYELGMLIFGMDLLNDGLALLGGNKSRGLGRVRIELEEVEEITPQTILEELKAEEEPSEPSSEEASEDRDISQYDDLQQDLRTCLEEAGSLDHEGLVLAMQKRGWTKAKLNEKGYRNWKELFDKSVSAGVISRFGDMFHPPGSVPAEDKPTPAPSKEETSEREEEVQRKVKTWKDALYKKLKQALEEKPCSGSSTTS